MYYENLILILLYSINSQLEIPEDCCQKCGQADNPTGASETVNWVECDISDKWYHSTCVHFDTSTQQSFACCSFSL